MPERIFGRSGRPGHDSRPSAALSTLDDPARGQEIQVVATAGHDTAAAFAGAPLQGSGVAIISSGTWSLVGVELDGPVLTERRLGGRALQRAGGVRHHTPAAQRDGALVASALPRRLARGWLDRRATKNLLASPQPSPARLPLFDPDHSSLVRPDDMPAAHRGVARESGQQVPQDRGGLARSIFTSLACKYRLVLEELERVTARSIDTVHVVGGGSSNALLCQLTADITRREVLAGPAEATALGNILRAGLRPGSSQSGSTRCEQVSRASFPPVPYHPTGSSGDAEATYRRFLDMTLRDHKGGRREHHDRGGHRRATGEVGGRDPSVGDTAIQVRASRCSRAPTGPGTCSRR